MLLMSYWRPDEKLLTFSLSYIEYCLPRPASEFPPLRALVPPCRSSTAHSEAGLCPSVHRMFASSCCLKSTRSSFPSTRGARDLQYCSSQGVGKEEYGERSEWSAPGAMCYSTNAAVVVVIIIIIIIIIIIT
jgi:hypothetical protein